MEPTPVLNHLNLPATEPEQLARWYERCLGLRREGCHVWAGDSLLVFSPGEPLPAGDRAWHFGFRAPSLGALVAWIETLRERGVELGALEGDEGYSTLDLRDPEGNCIELFYERAHAL